jgi:hypothetical protein
MKVIYLQLLRKNLQIDSDLDEKYVWESSSNSMCGTIRINRGLPRDMIEEAKMLKK